MSHKTGKRVLATTATSALAFAGLISMPFAAQAAPGDNTLPGGNLTVMDQCGIVNDRIVVKKDTGQYTIKDANGATLVTIDSGALTATGATTATKATATGTLSSNNIVFTEYGGTTWTGTVGTASTKDAAKYTYTTESANATAPSDLRTPTPGIYFRSAAQNDAVVLTLNGTDTPELWSDAGILKPDASATAYAPSGLWIGAASGSRTQVKSIDKTGTAAAPVYTLYSGTDGSTGSLGTYTVSTGAFSPTSGGHVLAKTENNAGAGYVAATDGATFAQKTYTVGEAAGLYVNGVLQPGNTLTKEYTVSSSTDQAGLTKLDTVNAADPYYYTTTDASWYDTTQTNSPIKPGINAYDKDGSRVVGAFAGVNGVACGTSDVVPVPQVNVRDGVITVTKGTGFTWTFSATDTVNVDDYPAPGKTNVSSGTITWAPGASADATTAIRRNTTNSTSVTVTATPTSGYSGGQRSWTLLLDGSTVQHNWVAPTTTDRNGAENDTFTVTNYRGVTYYYTSDFGVSATTPNPSERTPGNAGYVGEVKDVDSAWVRVGQSSAPSTTVNRPQEDGTTAAYNTFHSPVYIKAVADQTGTTKYAFDSAMKAVESATVSWTDETWVTAIPAPTLVNGLGAEDYYNLPQVEGVVWEVWRGATRLNSYPDNDPRLGTDVRVVTQPGDSETLTFRAVQAGTSGTDRTKDYRIRAGVKTSWEQKYDNRPTLTPVGPQFIEQTGLLNDAVKLPPLVAGIDYYEIAITKGSTAPTEGTTQNWGEYKQVDGSWYGKEVNLPELQRYYAAVLNKTVDYESTHVWIKAKLNQYVAELDVDADGNPVKSRWDYEFKNSYVIVPEPPIQTDLGGTANDTLTFPVETRVTYRVTDQYGSTKTIPYTDLGKPLHYTGKVTVAVTAAPGYQLQPNTDGSPFSGWTFEFDDALSAPITPGTPHSHDQAGTDQDTYELPNQPGVLWTADGVNVDPSTYGQRISTGGKTRITFVARPAQGYSFVEGAERTFVLNWSDVHMLDTPEVDYSLLPSGWQATASWEAPANAEGDVTYDVSFAKISEDEDGDEVVGPRTTWFEGTDLTEAQLNAGYNTKYRVYVTATDENGTESDEGTTDIVYATDNSGAEANWVDINRSTVTPSGNDALGWYQAGSSLYFNNTAFVTYRDQSNITFTVNGGQQLRVYGTQYTKGGRALIQVNGTNWAWIDAGASSNADPYKKMLRQINLPNTGTHTIKIIASLLPGKELALDAYEVVR